MCIKVNKIRMIVKIFKVIKNGLKKRKINLKLKNENISCK